MKNRNIMKISFIAVALLMLASCVTLAVIDTDDSDAAAFSAGSINFNSTGSRNAAFSHTAGNNSSM